MQDSIAKMQAISWDSFRYVLAVFRCETLSAAARSLAVNETTVSRRLAQTEEHLQTKLFSRSPSGLKPTDAGALLVSHLERAEAEIEHGSNQVTGSDRLVSGGVRIAADPLIVNHLLVPNLQKLMEQHSDLKIELIAVNHSVSVARREADIAIQIYRPADDSRVLRSRIGKLSTGVYAASRMVDAGKSEGLPWLTYDEEYTDMPMVRWVKERAGSIDNDQSRLVVNNPETLLRCMRANLGKSLLPDFLASEEKELTKMECAEELPTQDIWLICQPELREIGRIKAAVQWLESCFDNKKISSQE